ncbi:hypothetical protein K9S39_10920 [Streptomyces halobius]|uniref:Uncharacterized protein n=1 Tax=Streptomyces halobius TaxID=2879846 RepID=A0ABY4MP27_9ACTN|nr:hypothetical protein [Streptomyces halobius]UQA98186.1 hypothetical protein K9S39_10920 [Streptomyces halobius]
MGSTTTIDDFAVQARGRSLRAGLGLWHAGSDAQCAETAGTHADTDSHR